MLTSTSWTLWYCTATLVLIFILLSATYRLLMAYQLSSKAKGRVITGFAWSTEAVQLAIAALGPVNVVLSMRAFTHVSHTYELTLHDTRALGCILFAGTASLHALAVYTTHMADALSQPDHGLEGHDLKTFMLTRAVFSSAWRACAPQVRIYVHEPAPFPALPRGWCDQNISRAIQIQNFEPQNPTTNDQLLSHQADVRTAITTASQPGRTSPNSSIASTTVLPRRTTYISRAHDRSHQNSASCEAVSARSPACNGIRASTSNTKAGFAKRKARHTSRAVADAVARLERR